MTNNGWYANNPNKQETNKIFYLKNECFCSDTFGANLTYLPMCALVVFNFG